MIPTFDLRHVRVAIACLTIAASASIGKLFAAKHGRQSLQRINGTRKSGAGRRSVGRGAPDMGKMVRWIKRGGWQVGPTPFQYCIGGLHFFKRLEFKGLRHNRGVNLRRKPLSR